MPILIIEDEIRTASFLKKGLKENGFVVDIAHSGEDGLHLALSADHDLIILDVMLPERDGWSILEESRQQGKQTPVLFLTACDKITDRVKGLNLGADDYLVKPFAFSELLARIHAVLRRSTARQPDKLSIADLDIDFLGHKVVRGGIIIDLTPKEFVLLGFLAKMTGQVLTRTMIAEHVWDINLTVIEMLLM
jgi:two-component system copper resistance phosphate regulon response regulator CusR